MTASQNINPTIGRQSTTVIRIPTPQTVFKLVQTYIDSSRSSWIAKETLKTQNFFKNI